MSLEQKLIALAQAVGADIKADRASIGNLNNLTTTQKGNLVAAINEINAALASSGVQINDTTPSTTSVYSSSKTEAAIAAAVAAVINGAPEALNTLNEIATALGEDDVAINGILTALALRVRVDAAQTFTAEQQATARSNIGAVAAADIGNTEVDLVASYTAAKA